MTVEPDEATCLMAKLTEDLWWNDTENNAEVRIEFGDSANEWPWEVWLSASGPVENAEDATYRWVFCGSSLADALRDAVEWAEAFGLLSGREGR